MDAVVAVYSDWGIGARGTQPLVIPADRKRFRELTGGHAVIVGRKTLEDFPGGRPLKDRHSIVITRQDITVEGAEVAHSVEEALAAAEKYDRCLIINGASMFSEYFPHLTRVFVTKIDAAPHSGAVFLNLDAREDWQCTQQEAWQEHEGVRYCFCVYEKRSDQMGQHT